MEKQTASPIAGAPANGSHTPDKPKNASEHRKVSNLMFQKNGGDSPQVRNICTSLSFSYEMLEI